MSRICTSVWILFASATSMAAACAAGDDAPAVSNAEAAPPEHETVPLLTDDGVETVTVDRVDGLLLVDGDIEISETQLARARVDGHARGATVPVSHLRWTGGVVPYEVDPSLPSPLRIAPGIGLWQSQTPFTFVAHTTETDFVKFVPGTGSTCASFVGRIGGQQNITLGPSCTPGQITHEMGHAIGLFHEHARSDRDTFIAYHQECELPPGGQFTQFGAAGEDLGPYDYHSIMHFGRFAFSNGCSTLVPQFPYDIVSFGQAVEISEGDVMAAGKLFYGTAQATHFVPADYDGDGRADLAYKDDLGYWRIDFAADGFQTGNDLVLHGFGNASAHPVPADYDGDTRADLSVKTDSGAWYIDYSSNGFNGWDVSSTGYGNALSIPVPADYDGDCKADLAVKTSTGTWYIDYSSDGIGPWNTWKTGYGDATYLPLPADYDGDGKADLAVKNSLGEWKIDYAALNGVGVACTTTMPCYGSFELSKTGYGNASAVPAPADYDGDCKTDLSIRNGSGTWYVDKASDGFNGWNTTKLNAGSGLAVPFTSNFDGDFGTATVTCGTPGHLAVRLCPIADMSWKETDRAGALFSDRSGNGLSTTHDTLLPLGI